MTLNEKIMSVTLGLSLALCGCISITTLTYPIVPVSLWLTLLSVLLAGCVLIKEREANRNKIIYFSLIAYLTTLVLSALYHENSFWEFSRIGCWIWYCIFFYYVNTWPSKIKLLGLMTGQLFYLGWVGYYFLLVEDAQIATSYLDNPNIISMMLVGFTVLNQKFYTTRSLRGLYLFLSLGLLFFLQSEGAFLALGSTVLLLFPLQISLIFITAIVVAIGHLKLVYSPAVTSRLLIWEDVITIYSQSPLTGVGIYKYIPYDNRFLSHAHNAVLHTVYESGVLGFGSILFIIIAIRRQWDQLRVQSKMLCIAFGAWSLIDDPFHWIGSMTLFVLALTLNNPNQCLDENAQV